MEKWIADVLGPYYGVALAFGGLLAWWLRSRLRRAHVLIFAGTAVLAGSGFCVIVLVLVIGGNRVAYPTLALFGLHASAAITTAAASALLVSLLLIAWRKR